MIIRLILTALLAVMTVEDARYKGVTIGYCAAFGVLSVVSMVADGSFSNTLVMIVGLVFLCALSLRSLGLADYIIIGSLFLCDGPKTIAILSAAMLLGGIYVLVGKMRGSLAREVAFVPFIMVAYLAIHREYILFALLCMFAAYDLMYKKVLNRYVLPAIVLGVILGVVTRGVMPTVTGLTVGFVVALILNVCGVLGMGDVKLFMLIGAMAGIKLTLKVLIGAVWISAIYGIVYMIWHLVRTKSIAGITQLKTPFVPGCALSLGILMLL